VNAFYTVSQKTGTPIHMATTTWFFVLMSYPFCHINYDLFPINCVIFNKIPYTVYEVQMFKKWHCCTNVFNMDVTAAPVWLTVRRTVCSQSGHRFHEHTPSIEHAIAWWFSQWFPVGNGATLRSVFSTVPRCKSGSGRRAAGKKIRLILWAWIRLTITFNGVPVFLRHSVDCRI